MTSPPTAAPTAPDGTPERATRPFLVLGIVLTAVFVQLLDVSIVNVAIPSIQADLGASAAAVQLVLAGYQQGVHVTPQMQNTVWISLTIIPAISCLVSAVPFFFYRLGGPRK